VRALVALVGLVLVAMTPAAALAHAVLLRATPSSAQTLAQAPAQVQLLFSEPLDPVFSHVQVQNAAGEAVDLGDSHVDPEDDRLLVASLQPGLPNGVYSVNWRSLSAIDVHPDEGQFPLFVGVPVTRQAAVTSTYANTATPATTFARWWFYVAASLFGGVLATWKLVVIPLFNGGEGDTYQRAPLHGRAFGLIVAGGILLLVGTLFSAVAQAASAANVPLSQAFGQPLADLLLRGRFASIWWPRLGLEVAGLALIVFGGIDGLAAECALATLPAVLLTSALTSHGAALPGGAAPGIAIDWLHIVGATAWVGGLMALAAFLPVLRADSTSPPLRPRLLARFARFALVTSMVVLLSGVLQSALEVGSWAALISTPYGQLVLIKVAFMLAMLGMAAYNEWRARRARTVGLQRSVGIELALGVLVFGVAAVLSGTPPSLTA
jgi:copper transport protein